MPSTEGLTLALGEDWTITVACKDASGSALDLTGGSAVMRIASPSALALEKAASVPTPTNGEAVFLIAPSDQSGLRASTLYQIEARAVLSDGTISEQFAGTLYVKDSLFVRFP